MYDIVYQVIIPIATMIAGGIGTWLYNKTPKGRIEIKSSDIDVEIRSATFYRDLLDDATRRLKESIVQIEERDERIRMRDKRIDELITSIEERDDRLRHQDKRIEELIHQVELMTGELKKYKQLNGKSHEPIAVST